MEFEVWKQHLKLDAMRTDRDRHIGSISDYVLRLFWERGCAPTIEGLLKDVEQEVA